MPPRSPKRNAAPVPSLIPSQSPTTIPDLKRWATEAAGNIRAAILDGRQPDDGELTRLWEELARLTAALLPAQQSAEYHCDWLDAERHRFSQRLHLRVLTLLEGVGTLPLPGPDKPGISEGGPPQDEPRPHREVRECVALVENPRPYQPKPPPPGRNPYLTLRHILHELWWQAACARRGENLLQHINPTIGPWDEAETRARSCSAGWGIPFATFDPILTAAKRSMRELSQVAAGNTSVPFSAVDSQYPLLEERLRELANSIPLVQLFGPMPVAVWNWLTARYLADPTPEQLQLHDDAEPEPVVFVRFEDFAGFLVGAGVELLPNLDDWKDAGWIEDVFFDITPSEEPNESLPDTVARLNLPLGRHRLIGIRQTVLTAPTEPTRPNAAPPSIGLPPTGTQQAEGEQPPADTAPSSTSTPPTGTKQGEGGKPLADPFVPLTSWNEILAALNEPHGKPQWKNDEQTRDKIRKLNEQHKGPIRMPNGRGKQPSVDKAALLTWWNGLREHFDARQEEEKAETESARLTVSDSHNYGGSGTVIPGISGSEKRTRSKESENGKERKR